MSLFKSASTVSLLTLASRIAGLVRDLLMASVFGVSALTDAFNVAFRIPNLFRRVLGEGAFSQAFVPVLAATRTEHGDEGARALVDHVATLLTWTLVLLCIAGMAGAPLMVWAMASGLAQTAQGHDAAVFMTRWMFSYIGFMSLVALAGGILNTWRRFAVPAASPVLLNLSLILSILIGAPLFRRWGIEPIYAQCVGVMVGGALQLGIQLPALRRIGMLPHVGTSLRAVRAAWADPTTRRIVQLMLPALVGVSVAQISLLINTQIASHLAPGSVTWVSYADRLMEFPTAMLGVALGVVLMPQLASARAAKDDARYSSLLDWGLRLVVLMSVPCAVALLLFSRPLVAVLFHNGAFDGVDVERTTVALMGYGAGLLRAARHALADAHRRVRAGAHATAQPGAGAGAAACRADPDDRPRRDGQRPVAADRPDAAWQLPARTRLGPLRPQGDRGIGRAGAAAGLGVAAFRLGRAARGARAAHGTARDLRRRRRAPVLLGAGIAGRAVAQFHQALRAGGVAPPMQHRPKPP